MRKRILIGGLLAVVTLGALAWGAWWWLAVASPPTVDLDGVDPDVVAAVESARAQVVRSPRSAHAWGRLGMVLRVHDFGPEANVCFAEAERLDPRDPRWPYLQGLTLLLSDLDAGIAKVRRGVELCEPSRSAPRLRLADSLVARGQTEEAEAHYRDVLKHEPDNPRALLGLGRLAVLRDDIPTALDLLQRARESDHSRKAATLLLAEVHVGRGDQAAVQALGDVTALPDDVPWPDDFVAEVERERVGLGVILRRADEMLRNGNAADAVALLQKAAADRPRSDLAWLELGTTLVRVKDHAAAERALRTVVELNPASVEGWFQRGVALYFGGRRGEAMDCFRMVLALKPDHPLANYNLGHCLKEAGDRDGAAEAFRAALKAKPDYAEARKQLDELEK